MELMQPKVIWSQRKHQNMKSSGKIQETLLVVLKKTVTRRQGQKEFFTDLTEALVDADIPLFKLKNEKLRSFLVKYTKQIIPDESTLRKNYVTPLFVSKLKSIANVIGDEDIYLILDETIDMKKRFVLNVLVGVLNGNPTIPMLF
jgi:signal recognition particle GTPase